MAGAYRKTARSAGAGGSSVTAGAGSGGRRGGSGAGSGGVTAGGRSGSVATLDAVESGDEVLALLQAAAQNQPQMAAGFTTVQCAEALGISVITARGRLRALLKSGLISPVKVAMVDMSGRSTTTIGYRMVK